jgi:RNA polymerase sigma factor (sigma-70 family)
MLPTSNDALISPADVTSTDPDPVALDKRCLRLREMALSCAERQRFTGDDAEDCAQGFVLDMLLKHRPTLCLPAGKTPSDAWYWRCAVNWVRFWARTHRREAHRLPILPNPAGEGEEPISPAPGPETIALKTDLLRQILQVVPQLTRLQQRLFVRYYLENESRADLARELGYTLHALHQALWRLRNRLQSLLVRQGLTEEEGRDYLSLLTSRDAPDHPVRRHHRGD